jgi:protein-disulfide isomerase
VNGTQLTLQDVEKKRPTALFQARTSYHEAEKKAVEEFVEEYLLEQQARKENVTVAQLLERHVNSTIAKDPSEEALRVYYEGVETTESFEAVRDKIVDALRQRRIAKAKTAYLQSLRTQSKIAFRLTPPRAPISMKDTPVRGLPTARVTLLEFADYECPYCQQVQPVIDRITSEFKDSLAFAYKDFPLPMHANAQKAAEATRCAELQSQYWAYHDQLVKSKQLDMPALKSHARELKLDTKKFDQCLDGGETAEAVKAHLSEAQLLGLQGTPTFFVNGRIVNNPSYDRIREMISEELKLSEGQNSASASSTGAASNKVAGR